MKRRFYKTKWFFILILFVFPIFNLIMIWKSNLHKGGKCFFNAIIIVWTLFLALMFLAPAPSKPTVVEKATTEPVSHQHTVIPKIKHTAASLTINKHPIITVPAHHTTVPHRINASTKRTLPIQSVTEDQRRKLTYTHKRKVTQKPIVQHRQQIQRTIYVGVIKQLGSGYRKADLHCNPNSHSSVLTRLSGGTHVTIIHRNYNWTRVQLNSGLFGYVYTNYINFN